MKNHIGWNDEQKNLVPRMALRREEQATSTAISMLSKAARVETYAARIHISSRHVAGPKGGDQYQPGV